VEVTGWGIPRLPWLCGESTATQAILMSLAPFTYIRIWQMHQNCYTMHTFPDLL
jgi:hypothetical protein